MMQTLDGKVFKAMLQSAAVNLANHAPEVDTLNVFPVPDGDTGTNMSMTFSNGVNDALNCHSDEIGEVAKALSKGLLMGARGNSGVITSQIWRGFAQSLAGKKAVNVQDLTSAFENGTKVAYKAIMKPVEGTILTVIREGSASAKHYYEANPEIGIEEYFTKLAAFLNDSLVHTPDLLPILKEAGVVDSGGKGLTVIFEGFKAYLAGKPFKQTEQFKGESHDPLSVNNTEFGYCTEFIIRLNPSFQNFDETKLRDKLAKIGESLVVVKDEDIVKVHVHTLKPGDALNLGQRYGEFVKLKIENMQEQHSALTADYQVKKEKKKYGIIAVAAGEGLTKLFKEYRADTVICGGQTMNPSTESFTSEIRKLNCDHILILPNNANIILAAQQAKELMRERDIQVLNSHSVQEGWSALSMFNPEADLETNLKAMNEAMAHIKSGSLTYAIKDTSYNGLKVRKDDYIAMTDKKIVAAGKERYTVLRSLIDVLVKDNDDDYELIMLIKGEGAEESELKQIKAYVEANYNDFELDIIDGGQPVYAYLVGVE